MSTLTLLGRLEFFGKFNFGGGKTRGKKQGASPLPGKRALRSKGELRREYEAPQTRTGAAVASNVTPNKKRVKRERKPLPWRALGVQSMPVLAVTLVLGLLVAGWQLLDYVGSVPVSRVAVTGKLLHVDRALLVERVRPHLRDKGFMTVDLAAIRADALQLPWVADISIQRRWPDQLVIEVTEQEAIARWGKDGLLNRRGEVFRPQSLAAAGNKSLGDIAQLPLLYGPDNLSGAVVEHYAQLRDLLSQQKLVLSDLGSDARGSWSATLQGGVVLRLGTGDILKKMRSFARVYQSELSAQMDSIAYIDLRYGNGLAVGWKHGDGKNKNTNSGVSGNG